MRIINLSLVRFLCFTCSSSDCTVFFCSFVFYFLSSENFIIFFLLKVGKFGVDHSLGLKFIQQLELFVQVAG